MTNRREYAEQVNYWKTGQSSPDMWLEKAKREIRTIGGKVAGSMIVNDELAGHDGYVLAFQIGEDQFKMMWPVLKSKSGNLKAARIQAATALYHEVKAACVKVKFLGARAAFFAYLALPDGRTASQLNGADLIQLPSILLLNPGENND